MTDPHARNVGVAAGTLLISASTLVCCVLPALLVSIGAGAVLVSLVTAVPQLVWLSEHKPLVFGSALAALLISGAVLWRARGLACPTEPRAARICRRMRQASTVLYLTALAAFVVGGLFAFVLA